MENFEQRFPSSDKINSLDTYDTVLCSDSVEWCPHAPHRNAFVCGCYQLDEEQKSPMDGSTRRDRSGRILLLTITPDGLKLHQQLETAGVLDQKWCHTQPNGHSTLAVANSAGTIELYNLDEDSNGTIKLILLVAVDLAKSADEILILSLDWSTAAVSANLPPEIVCSSSKGDVHRLRFETNNDLTLLESWHAHEYEAWTSAYYYWNTNVVFTGGDDSLFLTFDLRAGKRPVNVDKSYEAGVTTIHSNKKREFLTATGSYDSRLKLWDVRHLKAPQDELELPGTLWRLKWDPFDCNHLVAACMLGGVHVVESSATNRSRIVESFYGHENLAYGVDWCYMSESEVDEMKCKGNRIIASCSFYDHLLCVSKLYCGS